MKVLKDTSKDGKWIGECQNCYSIVEVFSHELNTDTIRNLGAKISWMSCPVCGSRSGLTLFYPKGSDNAERLLKIVEDDQQP